jgi:hypothetical protein
MFNADVRFKTAMQGYQDASGMSAAEYIPSGPASMEVLVSSDQGTAVLIIDLAEEEAEALHRLARNAALRYLRSLGTT